MIRVRVVNIDFGFRAKKIFKDFSLELSGDGNPVVILGPSGCGKTTLLRLIAGLLRPDSGDISVEEADCGGSAAFVFQEARLLPYLNVLENVMLPIVKPLGKIEAEKRALFFLRESALYEYAKAYPDKLSGGQKQRVSIARAWAYPAPIVLMDEPFQSLDIPLRVQLMDLALNLLETESRFIIAVTHDPREAIYLGRRIIVLGMPSSGGTGVVFDEAFDTNKEKRRFVPENSLEERLISHLQAGYR
jgi:NitT/TauT family transport system ATP-binding protein